MQHNDDGIVDYDDDQPEVVERCKIRFKSLEVNHGNELDQFMGKNGDVSAVYMVQHNNGETTLEQELHLSRTYHGWIAEIKMDDMPHQETVTAAAWKTAEWLERLAKAIKSGTYDQINLNGL